MIANSPVNFFWVRGQGNNPLACVAYEITSGKNFVKFAVAVHNPKDLFNKQRGREIALARLNKGVGEIATIETYAKRDIMKRIARNEGYSDRIRFAAAHWLDWKDTVCP